MSKNYNQLAKTIVENVGGQDNISECYHCMSRLRLRIKNLDVVDIETIKELGFIDAVINGNQVQVIAGNEVYDIYDAVSAIVGEDISTGELKIEETKHTQKTLKDYIWAFFGGISNSVQPCIPVLIGAGVLQGLYLIAAEIGVLSPESNTYQLLVAICNSAFYFLPIMVGFNCAKQYGGNQLLGAFLGAILVHPDFMAMVNSGNAITFLGLPVRAVNYSSSVLPAFISVWAMCHVEKFIARISPKSIKVVLEPFVTVVVMVPLTLWICAPIGDYLGIGFGIVVTFVYNTFGPFAPAILAAVIPFLVLTGTHSIIGTLAIQTLSSAGKESIMMPGALIHNFNHVHYH